jgi:hypothetical protein
MLKKIKGLMFAAGLAIGIGAAAYTFYLRPRHLRWGASDEEVNLHLPGDDLVPKPRLKATHAVTIEASPAAVWPWLVQIGQGRGGFYSYDWIENTMGLDIHTTDKVLDDYQDLKVGDLIPLAPGGIGIPVAILIPESTLVLHGDTRTSGPGDGFQMRPGDFLTASWGFYLFELGEGRTRLVERFLADWNPNPPNTMIYRLFVEPGAFIMERKMLSGIKERAEQLARGM